MSPPVGCYRLQPPSTFIVITQPESWYSFTVPRKVKGWVDLGTAGRVHTARAQGCKSYQKPYRNPNPRTWSELRPKSNDFFRGPCATFSSNFGEKKPAELLLPNAANKQTNVSENITSLAEVTNISTRTWSVRNPCRCTVGKTYSIVIFVWHTSRRKRQEQDDFKLKTRCAVCGDANSCRLERQSCSEWQNTIASRWMKFHGNTISCYHLIAHYVIGGAFRHNFWCAGNNCP